MACAGRAAHAGFPVTRVKETASHLSLRLSFSKEFLSGLCSRNPVDLSLACGDVGQIHGRHSSGCLSQAYDNLLANHISQSIKPETNSTRDIVSRPLTNTFSSFARPLSTFSSVYKHSRRERFTSLHRASQSSSSQIVDAGPGLSSPAYAAVLVDVGGTLLQTAHPVPDVYAAIGEKYGVTASPEAIKKSFKEAFAAPWPERLRYEGDGRPFWRYAVALATGCNDETFFEELYTHYACGEAWKVADGAAEALGALRQAGVKLAVVSNFDSRLRPVLRDLQVDSLFDAIIVSSEVGHEKPSPEIFLAALDKLGVSDAASAVHIGDDAVADKEGAEAVGLTAWLWRKEVKTFEEVRQRVLRPTSWTPSG